MLFHNSTYSSGAAVAQWLAYLATSLVITGLFPPIDLDLKNIIDLDSQLNPTKIGYQEKSTESKDGRRDIYHITHQTQIGLQKKCI